MKNNKSSTPEKSTEQIEAELKQRRAFTLDFTFNPNHQLTALNPSDIDITVAVSEAAFIESVLRHELVTDDLLRAIRALLFASCVHIAESLEYQSPDPQMVIDIYPYGRLVKKDLFAGYFASFFLEVQETAPELFQSLAEVNSDGK